MTSQNQHRIIPIYSTKGDAEAFLVFPYLFNRSGEWIGWVTPKREVYSVMGVYAGTLTDDARVVRKRSEGDTRPHIKPPARPGKIKTPPTIPLAPLMRDLPFSMVDVFQEEPERLHTADSGELREDMD